MTPTQRRAAARASALMIVESHGTTAGLAYLRDAIALEEERLEQVARRQAHDAVTVMRRQKQRAAIFERISWWRLLVEQVESMASDAPTHDGGR